MDKQFNMKKLQMSKLQEALDRVSVNINRKSGEKAYITVIDIEYAFGLISWCTEIRPNLALIHIVGGKITGHNRFIKEF